MLKNIELTNEFRDIIELVENTNENLFITGGAGTGKSTLLKHIMEHTKKKYIILAPTGIAAINVGGQTIHSFFHFPITLFDKKSIRKSNLNNELFLNLDMMIVDEISMVRVDILDAIDIALRMNRDKNIPFGGVQMIFVGDIFQLPPVLTTKDNDYIFQNYTSHYFFDAPVFNETSYKMKELTHIFRQDKKEIKFKETLNRIRINEATDDDLNLINSRYNSNFKNYEAIFLTTRRDKAEEINNNKLSALNSSPINFQGSIIGEFEVKIENKIDNDKLPAPYNLVLKEGAQVMFLRNDKSGRWVNGTIGNVVKLKNNLISVSTGNNTYNVEQETWEQIEYNYNKNENKIEKQVVGKYIQYPLQLAYAVTIHKSQGSTFDKVNIDIGNGSFTHGQIYVALSRCRTLDGIILNTPIHETDIIVDQRVLFYYKKMINPDFKYNTKEMKLIELEKLFRIRLDEAINIMTEQYSYEAPILQKMVSQLGVRNAIRKLVNSPVPNKGLYTLKGKKALHLCMERLILEDEWIELFTENDRDNAKKRLRQIGYDYINNKYNS